MTPADTHTEAGKEMNEHETPPIITELFKLLPPPGEEFGLVERMRWISAAEAIFRLLYRGDAAQIAIESHKAKP